MNSETPGPIPDDVVLLKSTSNSAEAVTITGLLQAHGIETYTTSEGDSSVTGRMDGALPLYRIFVSRKELDDARKLIDADDNVSDYEWRRYRQQEEKKSSSRGRAVGLLIAGLLYVLSLLPMDEPHKVMKYILGGASFFLILLILISFYRGKEDKRR